MSHIRLFQRALKEQLEVVVQLEGDMLLEPHFQDHFTRALAEVPRDWDLLYLSGCDYDRLGNPFGGYVGAGIRSVRFGWAGNPLSISCPSWAFAYRSSTAAKILAHLQQHKLDLPFDVALGLMSKQHLLTTYTADPWLLVSQKSPSQIQNIDSPAASTLDSSTQQQAFLSAGRRSLTHG